MMNRTHSVTIRFTEAEYKKILRVQKKTTSTISAFVRKVVLGRMDQIQTKERVSVMKIFLLQYAAYGNNLNQIARTLNAQRKGGRFVHLSMEEMRSIASLEHMINEWSELLKSVDPTKLP